MYWSQLVINVGEDPTRYRPARQWLRNAYRVHQRLCMAFPKHGIKYADPDFLAPFDPGCFVHDVKRTEDSGFLFRVEPTRPTVILVQSSVCPDWEYAFHNAEHLLREKRITSHELVDLKLVPGKRLSFRLLANPTKRLREASVRPDGDLVQDTWVGKRVPVADERLEQWLTRRAANAGFLVREEFTTVHPGYVYWNKTRDPKKSQHLRSVRYDGVLEIIEPKKLCNALMSGIGPAKSFGFGLLSVRQSNNDPFAP